MAMSNSESRVLEHLATIEKQQEIVRRDLETLMRASNANAGLLLRNLEALQVRIERIETELCNW